MGSKKSSHENDLNKVRGSLSKTYPSPVFKDLAICLATGRKFYFHDVSRANTI